MTLEEPTLNTMLDQVAGRYPGNEAIVGADARLTYEELHESVRRFARGLLDIGVRKGDHVGLMMSNRAEWFIANFAIQRVGATMVGLNTWYKRDELEYALRQTDVSTFITRDSFLDNDYLDRLTDIAPEIAHSEPGAVNVDGLPFLTNVVVLGEAPPWAYSWEDIDAHAATVSEGRVEAAAAEVSPSDPAYILFSSGTTGRPKPILLKHDGLTTNPLSIGARLSVSEEDRFWMPLPLFFSFAACNESITALSHGATLVVHEQFEPETAVELIAEEQCTIVYGMGNMYRRMESHTDADLSSVFDTVRLGLIIAPEALRVRMEREYGIDKVLNGYGLTEVCAICAITHPSDSPTQRRNTTGFPLVNVDVRIKDPETGEEVVPGEEGEICLRTRTLFKEYYKMPERTREAFDSDGYFHTGDIGQLTPDGRLVFLGRMKDMIKTGGINVSPEEVKNVLEELTEVAECTVVGIPDEDMGELVGAVVRLREGADLTEQDVKSFCEGRIASYKVPDRVFFRDDAFPRTDTGKVRKVELLEEYVG